MSDVLDRGLSLGEVVLVADMAAVDPQSAEGVLADFLRLTVLGTTGDVESFAKRVRAEAAILRRHLASD